MNSTNSSSHSTLRPHVEIGDVPKTQPNLILSDDEVREAAGGYRRPAAQLRELHAHGFVRAYIPKVGRKRVVLERAHYDAVTRGQFGTPAANEPQKPAPAAPDRAALRQFFKQKRKL